MSQLTLAVLSTVLLALAITTLFVVWRRGRDTQLRAQQLHTALALTKSTAATEIAQLIETVRVLEESVARLGKWQLVGNAEEQAAELLQKAQASAEALRVDAIRLRETALREAEELKLRAQEEAAQVEATVLEAQARADAILTDAALKAEAMAGDALKALQQANQLERMIEALRNTVEGYGDRYLVPSHSLIDGLAEDVGHTAAGQKLKAIRGQIRGTVRAGHAATCDYVEPNRRETAIRFVVDAFNGKADSILARVKHDNAGTLQQELKDDFVLVNYNGQAFRNARITDEYLGLRLEEIRWAAVANELKLREREEQRRIKEQIREEEKARKEYERTMREAARDEEMLRKAMQKAEQHLAKANEEQRARYEQQLRELSAKLNAAEERNQRAISMAQQTKRGHVYIISNVGSFGEKIYKIGLTRRLDPIERIRELGDSSIPFDFDVHALIFAEDAPALECQLHHHFILAQVNKVNYRKEFFRVDLAHIRAEIEALGLTAKWTMTAEAREYRESLAIEKLVHDDPAAREAWLRRQLTYEPALDSAEDEDTIALGDGMVAVGGGRVASQDLMPPIEGAVTGSVMGTPAEH